MISIDFKIMYEQTDIALSDPLDSDKTEKQNAA